MKQWILFGILLLVILFLTKREHFEETETIKNPAKWNDFEIQRIREMDTPPLDKTKYPNDMIRTIIGGFWNNWKAETEVITVSKIQNYLDSKVKTDANLANDPRILLTTEQRNKYLYILQKYYIDQGRPIFANVNFRQYYGDAEAATATQSIDFIASPDPTTGPSRSSVVDLSKSPSAQLELLKQTISTYTGIPRNDDTKLAYYITPIQNFYDTKYLPKKKQPTLDEIHGYVLTVSDANIPANMKSNFKPSLTSIIDYWFTEPTDVEPSTTTSSTSSDTTTDTTTTTTTTGTGTGTGTGTSSTTSGTTTGGSSAVTYGPNSGSSSAFGKNIWGPVFSGMGSPLFNRGTTKTTNADYPVLLGGQSDEESTRIDGIGIVPPSGAGLSGELPSSASLGSDPNSRFLPGAWNQATGTTDPYRLMGRYSTSSYSTKPDPVPFLTDFSAFFK
jgi:hypothetical protein